MSHRLAHMRRHLIQLLGGQLPLSRHTAAPLMCFLHAPTEPVPADVLAACEGLHRLWRQPTAREVERQLILLRARQTELLPNSLRWPELRNDQDLVELDHVRSAIAYRVAQQTREWAAV